MMGNFSETFLRKNYRSSIHVFLVAILKKCFLGPIGLDLIFLFGRNTPNWRRSISADGINLNPLKTVLWHFSVSDNFWPI